MPPFITSSVSLAPYTTFCVGGTARYFAKIQKESDLVTALAWAREEKLPVLALGQGSNTLIDDVEFPGLVLRMEILGCIRKDTSDTVHFTVGGGEDWDTFVEKCTLEGLWGLENLSGIPGTVGASPIQNINAYGASVASVIHEVRAYHKETAVMRIFSAEECAFAYRDSFFKTEEGSAYVIIAVTFVLTRDGTRNTVYRSSSQSILSYMKAEGITEPTPRDVRFAVLHARKNIGMLKGMYRSVGSFFKNTIVSKSMFDTIHAIVKARFVHKDTAFTPWYWELPDGEVKISTAFLMECTKYNKTDFKDMRWNGVVGISPLHTLSIVTYEGATSTDVKNFAEEIIAEVEKIFSVRIESEVCYLP